MTVRCLFQPNFVHTYVHYFARILFRTTAKPIKRRVSNSRRVSNKRRGLEATLEYQPYNSYDIATENLVQTDNSLVLAKQAN